MYKFLPRVQREYSDFFAGFAQIFHEKIGLSPNQITFLSFLTSLASVFFIFFRNLPIGLLLLFLSLFLDAIDGTVARKYKLETKMGQWLDIISDRAAELFLFLALYLGGYIGIGFPVAAYLAILLMTVLFFKTGIDFGGKRIMIFLGPFFGFALVFYLIIFIQLLSIIASLIKIKKYDRF